MSFFDLETIIIFLLSLVKSENIEGGIWFNVNKGSCWGRPRNSLEKTFCSSFPGDSFHNLFSITNLPISRFLDYLIASENYEDYMYSLVEAYNPAAVKNVMCTNTLSVRWDGYLYDCDFNQMLELLVNSKVKHISQYKQELLEGRNIVISQHCYGCTAGAGSSCQGVVA